MRNRREEEEEGRGVYSFHTLIDFDISLIHRSEILVK